jgi:hypothetical protein
MQDFRKAILPDVKRKCVPITTSHTAKRKTRKIVPSSFAFSAIK